MTIIAAADGSALGNPGPSGWAWYVDDSCWASGGWAHGTNNMGELTAVLDLLQQTAHVEDDLVVYCDSTYVINVITKWMAGWKRKGWRKKDGKPVLNVEIIKALDEAMAGRKVEFKWIKGHSGHPLNEAADKLANAAAMAWRDGRDPAPGPGISGASVAHPDATVGQIEEEPDLFSALAADSVTEPSTGEHPVIALERSLLTDAVRADRAAVAALLHPDWREIGVSGQVREREELLEWVAPYAGPVALEVVALTEVGPDAVLLVWRADGEAGETLRSSLWVRGRGSWRQMFHQGTRSA